MASPERIDTKRPWVNVGIDQFKCKYCDYTSSDPQAVRLHAIKKHCAPKLKEQPTGGAVEKHQQQGAQRKEVGKQQQARHRHTFRLLNPRVPAEAQAMNDGFSRVCTECDTLA